MNGRFCLVVAVVVLTALLGCTGPRRTPPEVEAEYRALLETLDEQLPGAAVARLTSFRNRNGMYKIAAEAEGQIERFRSLATGRYHLAREYAREGHFDRAESILEDLATHLPDTPDGESAKEHLAGEFGLHKAQWLMARQRWKESEEVARPLLERGVPPPMAEQLETILDGADLADAAFSMATRSQVQAACRQVVILLETMMVEEGDYPASFSISDAEEWDPIGSRSIRRSLSSIEGYQRTGDGCSFVCVSADGRHRIRVVDGLLEP